MRFRMTSMTRNALAISAILFLLQASPTPAQLEDTVYYVYQDADAVGCGGHAVAVRGQVLDNSFALQRAVSGNTGGGDDNTTETPSESCVQEAFCLLDPFSLQCRAITNGIEAMAHVSVILTDQSGIIDAGGQEQLFECDTSNSDIEQQLCQFSPQPCSPSSVYPSCLYSIVTGQELVDDPSILYNPSPPKEVDQTVYAVYYSNEGCTEMEGMEGIVLGAQYSAEGVADTVSCELSMPCMLNPTGPSCAATNKRDFNMSGVFNYQAEGDLVYCNGDANASCQNATLNQCIKSDLYPNCYQRMVSGKQTFRDPESIVTPPAQVDFQLNSTYYLIYYESQGSRGCFGSSVAIEGGVIGDRKTIQTSDSGLCSADTTCLIDPISPQCINATGGRLDTADIEITLTARGSLQLCDTSNVNAGEDLCLLDPPNCDTSSLYPACTYNL
ncbi:MAG: hypothetical protein SGILL_002655, partial [Bacillariaceae sp.]